MSKNKPKTHEQKASRGSFGHVCFINSYPNMITAASSRAVLATLCGCGLVLLAWAPWQAPQNDMLCSTAKAGAVTSAPPCIPAPAPMTLVAADSKAIFPVELASSRCMEFARLAIRVPAYPKSEHVNFRFSGHSFEIACHPGSHITGYIKTHGYFGPMKEIDQVYNSVGNSAGFVLDVGANVGTVTLYAAKLGFGVIAVEASELNMKRL
jgi:hypothetical protein